MFLFNYQPMNTFVVSSGNFYLFLNNEEEMFDALEKND
jgi:hypothetical protein